jgi:hypothetical protein
MPVEHGPDRRQPARLRGFHLPLRIPVNVSARVVRLTEMLGRWQTAHSFAIWNRLTLVIHKEIKHLRIAYNSKGIFGDTRKGPNAGNCWLPRRGLYARWSIENCIGYLG